MFLTQSLTELQQVTWPNATQIQKDTVLTFLTTLVLFGITAAQDSCFQYVLTYFLYR